MINAIIIDDVPNAISSLKADLADYCPKVQIVGSANGVVEGSKIIKKLKPQLIFLDIEMQDGTGFDLLEIIDTKDLQIIFTTSHNEFAIKAFKFSAIDYLLKPIDVTELKQAVNKALKQIKEHQNRFDYLQEFVGKKGKTDKIALNTSEKIHIIQIQDIIRCEASVNYTIFHLVNKKTLMVSKPLKEYDNLLQNHGFYRVHQSHLVNLNKVTEFVKQDGGYLILNDNSQIGVSSRKKAALIQILQL